MLNVRIKMIQTSIIIIGFGITVGMNACSPFESLDSNEFNSESFSVDSFSKTLHTVVKQNCAGCHGELQNPLFAVESASEAHDVLISNNLVDLTSPSQSFLVSKLSSGHNNFSAEVVNDVLLQISNWSQSIDEFESNDEEPGSVEFSTASKSSILMKAKVVTHGGALTQDEWDSVSGSSVNQAQLKSLIQDWVETPEGKLKMDHYIRLTLNQDVSLGNESDDIFQSLRNSNFTNNLRESFQRTVRDLIDRGRPFTEIATTNRFAVTTALLSGYAWLEDDDRGRSVNFRDLIEGRSDFSGIIKDSDFTDWRFVTFNETNSGGLAKFDDIEAFRNISNGATINSLIPRVGYFSTLAFITKYPTNPDNQFRNLTNQTLISGLGRTFNPSDNTEQPLAVGIPADHAQAGTQCYGCHRMLDPMRLVFGKKMDYNSRSGSVFNEELTSFSFNGYVSPMSEFSDLGDAIANHPKFAEAWVQKMCRAFNTSGCSVTDSTFQSIVTDFISSNFNFKEMYINLAASELVTGSKSTFTSQTLGFDVARTRKNHLCHSLEARQKQVLTDRGRTPASFEGGSTICSNRSLKDTIDAVGEDQTIRGVESVINSYPLDTFSMQAIERTCAGFGVYFVNGNSGISTSENDLEESIDLLTRYIAGLPEGHSRHELLKQALHATYTEAKEVRNMSTQDSLREIVTLACTTPDSISMGL